MSQRNERGIAILTVITALVALIVIAVPFAISMRLGYERSEAANARVRSQQQVDSTLAFLEAYMSSSTERVEIMNRDQGGEDEINSNPEIDATQELSVSVSDLATTLGVSADEIKNPYGTILGWSVEDENAKFNINSASCYALGNLLGLSVLSGEVPETATSIELESADAFPERGYVKIGRELIKYTGKDGARLTGCERGMAASSPDHGAAEDHKPGAYVLNYAAWAIAYYPIARHPGEFTTFDTLNVSDISRIAALDPEVPVITQADWERILPFVTCYSKGEVADGWCNIQPVVEGTTLPGEEEDQDNFNFLGTSLYFNTGTVIRLQEAAEATEEEDTPRYRRKELRPRRKDYGMVLEANPTDRYEHRMELFGKAHRRFDGNQMRVQARVRHPVNLNTASRTVLIALFSNLRLKRTTSPEERVTPEDAAAVADAILSKREKGEPLDGYEDFKVLLEKLETEESKITRDDRFAIYRNCQNSSDNGLYFGTAPACFRSFDVYTLHASCTISDAGGRLLAKRSASRVVEIGSQVTTSRIWDSQRDLDEQLIAASDARHWTTGPYSTGWYVPGVEPWPRWPKQLQKGIFPRDPYRQAKLDEAAAAETTEEIPSWAETNGDFRPAPARFEFDQRKSDSIYVEHFDREEYVDGKFADSGFEVGIDSKILKAKGSSGVNPFAIAFWWQPQSDQDGDVFIFDVGEDDFRNRFVCYVDEQDGDLVFGVSDNSDAQRHAELRYDLSEAGGYQEEVWYHVQLVAGGCHPSKMAMVIDGRAVGKPNIMSSLTGNLSEQDGTISVEDASGFPSRGAVIVGTEVIEFESASGSTLTVRRDADGEPAGRGARGTLAESHTEGTPVTLFGYSRPLIKTLHRGGATLAEPMSSWTPVKIDSETPMGGVTDAGSFISAFSNFDPAVEPRVWIIQGTGTGMPAGPLGGLLAPLQGGGPPGGIPGGGNPGGPPQGGDEDTTVIAAVIPNPGPGEIQSFDVAQYGLDAEEDAQEQLKAFQEGDGYCLVCYVGGTNADFTDFLNGGSDNVKGRVEFMMYHRSGSALTIERLDGTGGVQTAPEVDDQYEILLGWIKTTPSGGFTKAAVPVYIIPVSIRTTAALGNYVNPIDDDEAVHWMAQIYSEQSSGNVAWEWFRYSEIVESGGNAFFLQARTPNPDILVDRINRVDWDTAVVDTLKQGLSGAVNPDSGDIGGGDPGGVPPDEGGGGGSGPGGIPTGDPGGTPPDPGTGGSDPGGAPSDPGTGGSDPGGTPPDPGTGGGDPGGVPPDSGGSGDGPGGDGGVGPSGGTDPGGSSGDGPGGEGGVGPSGGSSSGGSSGDGPGGEGGASPSGGTSPGGSSGDGPGGEGGVGPSGGDSPPPSSGDGPGGEGGGDAPPGSGESPGGDAGGDGPADPGGGDNAGGGGGTTPPPGGGGDRPAGGGGGDDAGEPGDTDVPSVVPGQSDDTDETEYPNDESIDKIANLIRFRGVQDDWDGDNKVDDFWDGGGNDELPSGSKILPVAAVYGGPDPADIEDPEVFPPWPRPGLYDDITMVSGDDNTREGDGNTVLWSMSSNDERLQEDTDDSPGGDVDSFDLSHFGHLFALTTELTTTFEPSANVPPGDEDVRKYTRLMGFPSGEMLDNLDGLSNANIGISRNGTSYSSVVDEIHAKTRTQMLPFQVVEEFIGEDAKTITLIPNRGTSRDGDVPEAPGVIRLGNELIIYREVALAGGGVQFTECTRGVASTEPRPAERGTSAEVMFGMPVAVLTEGSPDTGYRMAGIGFEKFPPQGVVRLEDPETGEVELRLYTQNSGSELIMPKNDAGSGVFVGRYGTTARTWEAGTPVFWQPVRHWDRYSEYSDDPELSFWALSTELTDAFVKRVYWSEGQKEDNINLRVLVRFNEGIGWNASSQNLILQSDDPDAGGLSDLDLRRVAGDNALKFLYGFEDPDGDNLIGAQGLQANKIEVRVFMIYEEGAYRWDDPSAIGWKSTPKIESFGIEYVQQNRTRRHVER